MRLRLCPGSTPDQLRDIARGLENRGPRRKLAEQIINDCAFGLYTLAEEIEKIELIGGKP